MPRNGSGTMSISNTFVASTEIQSSPMNANFTDIASEITGSLPRDGQAGMTGQLKAANGSDSAPGICWGADTDTGFYRSATGSFAFVSDATVVGTLGPSGWVTETGYEVGLASGGTGASLTDPNADRMLFWDDSAGAVTWLAPGTGIAISDTDITLSFLGLEALTDPGADRIAFWDDSAGAFAWLGLSGLTVTGTTLAVDAATTSAAGAIEIATQAEMETATDTGRAVTPGTTHYHPGVAKFWVKVTDSGGTPAVAASYNVTSITDDATGYLTVTIATDFSSADWACLTSVLEPGVTGTANRSLMVEAQAAGTVQLHFKDGSNTGEHPAAWYAAGFGDHA